MSALRAFSKAAGGVARRGVPMHVQRAAFNTFAKLNEREVHVTDFKDGEASSNTFDTSKYPTSKPVSAEKAPDEKHVAQGLPHSVREQLNRTMASFTLTGKTAIVTGGARGLGNNMAQALAEAGVENLALFDVNKELGDRVAKELHEQTGCHVVFYQVDIRVDNAMSAAVQDVVARFGDLHILINSAGIAESNLKAEEYDLQAWRKTMDVNLIGAFTVNQAFAQELIKLGHPGSIINVASMSGGVVNYPQQQSAYNASKAGVIMMSRSVAAEWARYGIRVNCISPGYMDTALNRVPALDAQKVIWKDLTPQKRLGNVDELNGLAVFLASDASTYMTGANVIIDGGYTLW